MKFFRFIIALAIFNLCIIAFASDVCSVSYDNNGNWKLRAGLATDGSITWNHPGYWRFLDSHGVYHPQPGYDLSDKTYKPWTFEGPPTTWNSGGRWFVTMAHGKGYEKIHYNSSDDPNPYSKSMNKDGHDLTQMFTDEYWTVIANPTRLDLTTRGGGEARPAGRFCMFRVRITDANGANERYYWVGDTSTGSFVYKREWNTENFTNNPGKGKWGEYGEAVWRIATEKVDLYVVVNTIYDQARFELNLVNNSATTKYVSLGMYGTPSTTDNPSMTWFKKPYFNYEAFYDKDTLQGWYTKYWEGTGEDSSWSTPDKYNESDPAFFYVPGVGNVDSPLVLARTAVPDRLEMYTYRWNNTNTESSPYIDYNDNVFVTESRVGLSSNNPYAVDTVYGLPPKDSLLNKSEHVNRYRTSVTAFQSSAQALFDNSADATKPDYLIIDNSSNMLQFTKRAVVGDSGTTKMPFGQWNIFYGGYGSYNSTRVAMDDGAFPAIGYWPKDEKGVLNPYENTLSKSSTFPYKDQFIDPLSYMTVWGSKSLAPSGGTRKIVTYYGLAGKDIMPGRLVGTTFYRDSHALIVESPTLLSYHATTDVDGTDGLYPSTFVVSPKVVNMASEKTYFDFKILKVKITLPDGLVLADDNDGDGGTLVLSTDPNDPANTYYVNKNVTLGKNSTYDSMKISVKATGEYSGSLEYQVSVDGQYLSNPQYPQDPSESDKWTQTCKRKILLPATRQGYIYGGEGNLLANPFKNVKVTGAESDLPFNVTDVYGNDTVAYYWDTVSASYKLLSNLDDLRLKPQGYWVLKSFDEDSKNIYKYKFPTYIKPNDVNYGDIEDTKYYMADMKLTLYKGWNIISSPYVFAAQWLNCVVKDKNFKPSASNPSETGVRSMQQAIEGSPAWLYKTLYTWEPTKNTDGSFEPGKGKYVAHSSITTQLIPNKGYWVYSNKNLEIYFKPALYPDAKIFDDEYYTDTSKFFMMGNQTDEDYN